MKEKQFKKRSAILSCLQSTHSHPSAEMVYELLQQTHPDISLATVYRNLNLFKSQGLIRSLGSVDGAERFDAVTTPHVHFLCTLCGEVTDMPEVKLPLELGQAAQEQTGCQVDGCQLLFTGLCRSCRS